VRVGGSDVIVPLRWVGSADQVRYRDTVRSQVSVVLKVGLIPFGFELWLTLSSLFVRVASC
jgi:hypothetical protein